MPAFSMIIDLEIIDTALALTEVAHLDGGTITVQHKDGAYLDSKRLPIAQAQKENTKRVMKRAIEMHFRATGAKELQEYRIYIRLANKDIDQQLAVFVAPEETTEGDVISQYKSLTIGLIKEASEVIGEPYQLLKEQLTDAKTDREHWRELCAEERERNRALEKQLQEKTDELRNHVGQFAEANKAEAEGKAAMLVATSQARVNDSIASAVENQFPKLLEFGARALLKGKGMGELASMIGKPDAGPPPPGGRPSPITIAKAAQAFPPELDAKVCAIILSPVERARLLLFLYLTAGADVIDLLEQETSAQVGALAAEVGPFFQKKGQA